VLGGRRGVSDPVWLPVLPAGKKKNTGQPRGETQVGGGLNFRKIETEHEIRQKTNNEGGKANEKGAKSVTPGTSQKEYVFNHREDEIPVYGGRMKGGKKVGIEEKGKNKGNYTRNEE